MKKYLFVLFLAFVLVACSPTWKYTPGHYRKTQRHNVSIQIKEFTDSRNTEENDSFKVGKFLLHWVPFILWSNVTDVSAPEGKVLDMDSMTTELAEATRLDLIESGMFDSVQIVAADEKGTADYILEGQILETRFSKTITAYGLSIVGNFFSLFGIPSGNINESMSVNYHVYDKAGNLVLDKTYRERSFRLLFIYKEFSKKAATLQAKMYQNINRKLVKDLNTVIK